MGTLASSCFLFSEEGSVPGSGSMVITEQVPCWSHDR